FASLPLAVVGCHGAGRFALFGGPHVFESSALGLLNAADNSRFLRNVLEWLLADEAEAVSAAPRRNILTADSNLCRLTRVEATSEGDGERTIASVERILRQTGVLKALSRAKWMP